MYQRKTDPIAIAFETEMILNLFQVKDEKGRGKYSYQKIADILWDTRRISISPDSIRMRIKNHLGKIETVF